MMDIESVFIFYKVATYFSITRTASELDISKSVVSRKLAELEKNMGVPLLTRTTRNMRLTEEGKQFFTQIKGTFEQIEGAFDTTIEIFNEPAGKLRVTAPVEFSHFVSDQFLSEFHQNYPQIQVLLEGCPEKKDLVRDGFDIAIRIGAPVDSSYRYRLIGNAYQKLYASPSLAQQVSCLKDLDACAWVINENSSQSGDHLQREVFINQQQHTLHYKNIAFYASGLTNKKNLIAHGNGIGFLPEFIFQSAINNGDIVEILPGLTLPPVNIGCLFSNAKTVPARVRVFIDFICQKFQHIKLD